MPFHWRHVKVWVGVAIGMVGLVAIERLASPALPVAVALVGVVWLGLLLVARDGLQVRETFPELLRVPVVGRLLESRTDLRGRLAEEA